MIGALAAAVLASSTPALRSADVLDGLGVNVHVEYTDGAYRDVGRILADLDYLGVSLVRDAAPNPSNQGQSGYPVLVKAGVKFDLFLNGEPIAAGLKRLDELERLDAHAVVGIEGPNEVNNLGRFSYEGEADPHRAATKYQAVLYTAVKSDPLLAGVPVLAFTDYPYTFGRADIQNEHPYEPGDKSPGPGLKSVVEASHQRAPTADLIFTETGYSTSKAESDVSQLAQARLTLQSLLEAASLRVRKVYFYQLLDAYPDPVGADHEKHFGFFDLENEPKPAARMLRRLTALLRDEAPASHSFTPHPTTVEVASPSPDLRLLRLQKADGEEIVALWRDAPVFNAKSRSDVELEPVSVNIRISATPGTVTVTDPVAQTQGRLDTGSRLLRLQLGSDPLLVQVAPAAPST